MPNIDEKQWKDINSLLKYLDRFHQSVLGEYFMYRYGGDISTLWLAADFMKPQEKSLAKIPVDGEKLVYQKRRKANAWNKFLKAFKFRAKKPRESSKAYFKLRTKAASRKYKTAKGKKQYKPRK